MLKGIHQQLDPHESPAFFIQGPRPFSRLMFFCALSLVMMAIDARFEYLSQVRQWFSAALHPLEVVASAPNEWGRNINTYFTSHNQLIQENFKLKQQGLIDNAALQRLATVDAENVHLRTLLEGDAPIIPKATLGEVMHMGRDPFSNIITLNRGSRHDITPGQAVVDEQGVVGQITRVYPYTSEVTLITDKKLSIPIQIERNQLRAIAFGEGKRNTLDIPYLPTSVDIKVGDKLVTSGIDGVYPAGLAVAVVTQIKQSQDSPFAKIVSRPIAGVNNHKHVLILKIPESPAINPVTDNKPVLPRNNAQHLDQSVVDVLQKNNAAVDPHPVTELPSLDSTDSDPAAANAITPPPATQPNNAATNSATPNPAAPINSPAPTAPEHR
ncbi:MAG TPA: rod shape-determining protein MreC [Methylophilus sp.]|nr:rod shape-determining protein MreC [Methylophilus sp.]